MRLCPKCGRPNDDGRPECAVCGGELSVGGNRPQINFVLSEIPFWIAKQWIRPEQAEQIRGAYRERWRELTFGTEASVHLSQHVAPQRPRPAYADLVRPQPAPIPEPKRDPLAAFLEQASITYWHLVGALLLLAGLAGLVAYTWTGFGKYIVFALLLALTGGLFALARSPLMSTYPIGSTVLKAISSLLAPLDIITANGLGMFGHHLPANPLGLLSTALCLPIYGWLARHERSRSFTLFAVIDSAALLHFTLQSLLPAITRTQDPVHWLGVYGLFYVPLAAVFLMLSRTSKSPEKAVLWQWSAHAIVITTLLLSFAVGPGATSVAAALWLAGALYAGSALVFDEAVFASAGALFLSLALLLTLIDARLGADRWYWYVLSAQAMGAVFLGASCGLLRLDRQALAAAYRKASTATSGIAVVVQAVAAGVFATEFPKFAFSVPELWGVLACATASIAFFEFLSHSESSANPRVERGLSGTFAGYAMVTAYAIAATVGHFMFHAGLAFVVASAVLYFGLRRNTASTVYLAASVLSGCLYAAEGYYAPTLTSLVLCTALTAATVWRPVGKDDLIESLRIWLGVGAAFAAAILWETHLLPWLAARTGVEQNYGYVPLLLEGLLIVLADRWTASDSVRRSAIAQIAVAFGFLLVLEQVGYAVIGQLSISPLVMLGIGMIATGAAAIARKSESSASWAVALTGCVYGACVFDNVHGFTPSSTLHMAEVITTILLLVSAGLLGRSATALGRETSAATAIGVGVLGYVHGIQLLLAPSLPKFVLWALPVAVGLFAAAASTLRENEAADSSIWERPTRYAAVLLSILAMALSTMWPATNADQWAVVTGLVLYGGLVATMGSLWARREYIAISNVALSIAFWRALRAVDPTASMSTMALRFDLVSLVWLALAAAAVRSSRTSFARSTLIAAGAWCAVVGGAIATFAGFDRTWVDTMLVTGCALVGASIGLRDMRLQHLGVVSFLLAYAGFLWNSIGPWGVDNIDFYLAPAGLYVLAVGAMMRRGERAQIESAKLADWIGAILVLSPTFIAAWFGANGFVHAIVLATEGAVFVFAGIALRRRAFAASGTGFLIALVCLEMQGVLPQIHWSIYATLLGLLIIGSALFFEKRREEVLQLGRRIRESLREWE